MALATISIKRNDNTRAITDTLTLGGAAINLTGCTILLVLKNRATLAVVTKAGVIVSAAAGTVSCTLTTTETATAGTYDLEWQVTFTSGQVLTIPDDGHHTLKILADLNAA